MTKPTRPEREVLKSIMQLLKARGILHFRMNSGVMRNPKGQPVRFGTPGCADLLVLMWRDHIGIVPLWVEVKSSTGTQSKDQKLFQHIVEDYGHHYLVAWSAQDVQEKLEVLEARGKP
jgi:hypothetical protein